MERTLFDPIVEKQSPLAHRMRPRRLEDFVGQERVLAPGKPLRRWIETDRVPSLVFWGPPGVGKTTLARLVAEMTSAAFEAQSAVLGGVKELKEAMERARERRKLGRKSILFVDEIHRFNKAQQDALLPAVEDGVITLIGATTENPSFEMNSALLSRARVIRFEALGPEAIQTVLRKAIEDRENGLGGALRLEDAALEWLSSTCDGDARRALNALEAVSLLLPDRDPSRTGLPLSLEETQKALESALERQPIPYDKSGEEHYNVISAFIKSIRGSDPDAGLYYLARMLEGGEDPLFIARRLVVLASEDIGNADPRALQVAVAVKDAVHFVGMPEARINLAQAVTYLAAAPKSNASYVGIERALSEVRKTGALAVPMHLRNAVTKLMKNEGYGKNYQYAHDFRGSLVSQAHLPEEIRETRFYEPKDSGLESQIRGRVEAVRAARKAPPPLR